MREPFFGPWYKPIPNRISKRPGRDGREGCHMRAKTLIRGAFLLVLAAATPTEGARRQNEPSGRPKWPIRTGPGTAVQRGGAERLTRPAPAGVLGAHHASSSTDWCSHLLGGPRGERDF